MLKLDEVKDTKTLCRANLSFLCLFAWIHVCTPPLFTPASHHPNHDVGEASDPQGGEDEGQHEAVLPARRGAVRHGEVQQQAQRPGQQPLQLVTHTSCIHTGEFTVLHCVKTEIQGTYEVRKGQKVRLLCPLLI